MMEVALCLGYNCVFKGKVGDGGAESSLVVLAEAKRSFGRCDGDLGMPEMHPDSDMHRSVEEVIPPEPAGPPGKIITQL